MPEERSFGERVSEAFKKSIVIVLFGSVFFGCGGFFLWQSGPVNTLICERVERSYINCTIETEWLGWIPLGETPVYGLQEATVSTHCDTDDDGGCTYSIDLVTKQGDVSLSPPAVSGRDAPKQEMVGRINAFIDNPDAPTFRETHSEIGFQMLPIFVFMAVGLGIMVFGLLTFVSELQGRTPPTKADEAVPDETLEDAAVSSTPGKYAGMTGCQLSFTLTAFLLTASLLTGAFGLAAARVEDQCVVRGRGWSGGLFYNTSQVYISLATDPTVSATIYQTHRTLEEAKAATEPSNSLTIIPCSVNPWFRDQITLAMDTMPAGHIFWGLVGFAFLIGGFGIGNAVSILKTPVMPPPRHLPVRLQPAGGMPTTQLWFLMPMLIGLIGASYAFFMAAWQRLPQGDGYVVVGIILLLLSLAAAAGIAYFTYEQVYLLYSGSQTIVELSARTLRAGQPAQIYIAHRPGRLTVEALRIVLKCEETTRQRVRHGSGSNTSYQYNSRLLHEQTLYETTDAHEINHLDWTRTLEIEMPEAAHASTARGRYPEIRWWLEVKMTVPGAPDYKLAYPLRVKG